MVAQRRTAGLDRFIQHRMNGLDQALCAIRRLALFGRKRRRVPPRRQARTVKCFADIDVAETCDHALVEDQLQGRDLAGTYVNRGVLRMAVNQYDGAESDFQKSIAIDPSLGEAWVNLGALKIARHDFAGGIADIDKGLALGPQEPEKAYYNRALADEALDNETAAYYDYTKAAQLKPTWEPPRTELTRFTVRPAS